MPIPTAWQYRYEEGRAETIVAALRDRFGDDPRLPGLAHRLATQPDTVVRPGDRRSDP